MRAIALAFVLLGILTLLAPTSLSGEIGRAKTEFSLTDHTGRHVTQDDFVGKPTLLFFGFTRCPDICPTFLSEIGSHIDDLGEVASELNVVFVSLDPEHDTAKALSLYMESFHPRIVALTGPVATIDALAKELGASFNREVLPNGEVRVDHTIMSFILDRSGCPAGRMLIGHGAKREAVAAKLRALIAGSS